MLLLFHRRLVHNRLLPSRSLPHPVSNPETLPTALFLQCLGTLPYRNHKRATGGSNPSLSRMKVTSGALLATTLAAAGGQAVESTGTTTAHPCTTGTPVVSYGYTISYALVTPTVEAQLREGYEPDPSWSSAHLLGTEVSPRFPSLSLCDSPNMSIYPPFYYFPNHRPIDCQLTIKKKDLRRSAAPGRVRHGLRGDEVLV